MRTYEGFPAPDRDMANVEPEIAPAKSDVGPVTGTLFPMLTMGLGIAACLWGVMGLFADGNDGFASEIAMIGAGACFIIAGILMQTRSLLLPAMAALLGILLGIASRTML